MKPADVLDYFTTQQAVAEVVNVSQPTISIAFAEGRLPLSWQIKFVIASGGALKFDRATTKLLQERTAETVKALTMGGS